MSAHRSDASSDRQQAVTLLTKARNILAERLTDRVLELGDELLDDARGHSYAGEIENLYDQLGLRLNQVNTMLAGLPGEVTPDPVTDSGHNSIIVQANNPPEIHNSWDSEATPETHDEEQRNPYVAQGSVEPEFRFQDFAFHVLNRDLVAASRVLSVLFGLLPDRAMQCTVRFRDQLDKDPGTISRARQLRDEIEHGATNDALLLLWECFGLQGTESLAVMMALQSRLSKH